VASAWGSSWGSSWGDSWGAIAAAAAQVAALNDDGGHGYHRVKPPDWRGIKKKELRRILEALGEEIPEEVAQVVAKHTRPATRTHAPQIDIAALMRDMQAVQWLLVQYELMQERKRQDDEETAFLLLL
jgi:hypothetical protein